MQDVYKGEDIQLAVDAIIAAIPADERQKMGWTINWGDLRCVDVVLRTSLIGKSEPWVEVLVSECSPESASLFWYIQDRLAEAGYAGVIVGGEW